jgi:hypothetical protein
MKKSKVFEYFRTLTDNNRVKYVCLFCDVTYMNKNATRFARHIVLNCKNSPTEVKRDLEPKKHKEAVHNHDVSEEPIAENCVDNESDTFNEVSCI